MLQDLCAIVGGESAGFAVDPHFHTAVASQRYVAVVVDLHRGDVLECLRCRLSGIGDQLRDVERLAVDLQFHRRALSCDSDLLQLSSFLGQVDCLQIVRAMAVADLEVAFVRLVAHKRQLQRVVAVGNVSDLEVAFLVGHGALHQSVGALAYDFHSHEPQWFAGQSV